MTVKDYKDGKIIILSKAFDTRAKILNIFYFSVFTIGAIAFAIIAFSVTYFSIGFSIFAAVVVIGYIVAGYRFINKALQAEKIIVTKNNLTIVKTGFLSESKESYDNALISNFTHLDKQEITRHPLAGQSFDYLGFQTEQAVINEMHGDDRLAFNYKGKKITFGENIYTWDFDQLEVLLYDITDNDFRYTDAFEKTHNWTEENEQ